MPSVPNWISRAVIYENSRTEEVTPTTAWRATATQVIVTVNTFRGPTERRFKLDGLTEIGGSRSDYSRARLVPPDDPWVVSANRDRATRRARGYVMDAIDKQRLQDSVSDPEATIKKLFAIRVAVDEAIARVGEVL